MDTERETGRTAAPTAEIVRGLNDLLQLDHDAIGAYRIAVEKLEDRDAASQIAGYLLDHERHVRNLNELIEEFGGEAVNEPHATGPFKEALQKLGVLGGDKGLLIAFRTNELQVRAKYDSYAAKAGAWPENVKLVIDRNALDEERHYRWVTELLEQMGVPTADDQIIGAETKVRENMRRMSFAADNLRHKAAGGLEDAASRLDRAASEREASGGAQARAADAAHRVADGMASTAEFVRAGEMDELRADVEAQVKKNPLRAVLVTFAAGFVVGRILR